MPSVEQIYEGLVGTTNIDANVRVAAEKYLQESSKQEGYTVALATISSTVSIAVHFRQLASVILKRFAKENWPEVPARDKQIVRELLLPCLSDQQHKVRTAVGMAVAAIAEHDWPNDWPLLFDQLLALVNCQDPNGIHGAMRCLALVAEELTEGQLPVVVQSLFPELLRIVTSGQTYGIRVRARALSVFRSVASVCFQQDSDRSLSSKLIAPTIGEWVLHFITILQDPASDAESYALKHESLRCLTILVQYHAPVIKKHLSKILQPIAHAYMSSAPLYNEAFVISGDEPDTEYDSDGEEMGFESFILQLFEFLLTLAEAPRVRILLADSLDVIAKIAITYQQITQRQTMTWEEDPVQFVANEEEMGQSFTVRSSASQLLQELCTAYDKKGPRAIVRSAVHWLSESEKLRQSGSEMWWFVRESALMALGLISDDVLDVLGGKTEIEGFQIKNFVQGDLLRSITSSHPHACLRARELWCASQYRSIMEKDAVNSFMEVSCVGLGSTQTLAMRLGACSALYKFSHAIPKETLPRFLAMAAADLGQLLVGSDVDILYVVLETVARMLEGDTDGSFRVELSGMILALWERSYMDMMVMDDLRTLFLTICQHPKGLEAAIAKVLPQISSLMDAAELYESDVASATDQKTTMMAITAVDMLKVMVSNHPLPVSPEVMLALRPLCGFLMRTADRSALQQGSDTLKEYVRVAFGQIGAAGTEAGTPLHLILEVVDRLLNPFVDEAAALCVGGLIGKLLLKLSAELAPLLENLLQIVLRRLACAKLFTLVQSLLMVFARPIATNAEEAVLSFLEKQNIDGKSGLSIVMGLWTQHHPEFYGSYDIKVSTKALSVLMQRAFTDSRLSSLVLSVESLPAGDGSRMQTRSATAGGKVVTQVPFPKRLFSVLVTGLINADEEEEEGDDDGDMYEEEEEGYDDGSLFGNFGSAAAAVGLGNVGGGGKSPFAPAEDYVDQIDEYGQYGEDMFGDDDSDEEEDDPDILADPLNSLEVKGHLLGMFEALKNGAPDHFNAFVSEESSTRVERVQAIFLKAQQDSK